MTLLNKMSGRANIATAPHHNSTSVVLSKLRLARTKITITSLTDPTRPPRRLYSPALIDKGGATPYGRTGN